MDDLKLTIDSILDSFSNIMIQSARQAEKDLGYITNNGVKLYSRSPFPDKIEREIKVLKIICECLKTLEPVCFTFSNFKFLFNTLNFQFENCVF